jgi:REP element-mobilizing transposase RayT
MSLFGDVVHGVMRLHDAGRMVQAVWNALPVFYPGVDVDGFVVMPNHIHGILVLVGAAPCGRPVGACDSSQGTGQPRGIGQPQGVAPTLSLPETVHRFKTMTTKRYADGVKQSGWLPFPGRLWQRNYYEHIIRNEASLNHIRQYILDNPAQWAFDRENPLAVAPESEDIWQV